MFQGSGGAALLEIAEMAKARSEQDKPEPDDSSRTLFAVKGKPSWYAWLKEYSDSIGMDVMGAIDSALRQQAKRDEFPKPMPRRVGK